MLVRQELMKTDFVWHNFHNFSITLSDSLLFFYFFVCSTWSWWEAQELKQLLFAAFCVLFGMVGLCYYRKLFFTIRDKFCVGLKLDTEALRAVDVFVEPLFMSGHNWIQGGIWWLGGVRGALFIVPHRICQLIAGIPWVKFLEAPKRDEENGR